MALLTAPASIPPLQFFDMVTGSSPERRAERDRKHDELGIRLIEVGHDMYGWPPDTVERLKTIIACRENKE